MTRTDGRTQGQTEEQAQWQANHDAERARQHRWLVDTLQVWSACERKDCRRLRSCRNERPTLCLNAYFAAMPAGDKRWFQLAIGAMSRGASPEEAERIARERLEAEGHPPLGAV